MSLDLQLHLKVTNVFCAKRKIHLLAVIIELAEIFTSGILTLLAQESILNIEKFLQVTRVSSSYNCIFKDCLHTAPNSPHRQHIKSSLASLSKCECTFIICYSQ